MEAGATTVFRQALGRMLAVLTPMNLWQVVILRGWSGYCLENLQWPVHVCVHAAEHVLVQQLSCDSVGQAQMSLMFALVV